MSYVGSARVALTSRRFGQAHLHFGVPLAWSPCTLCCTDYPYVMYLTSHSTPGLIGVLLFWLTCLEFQASIALHESKLHTL